MRTINPELLAALGFKLTEHGGLSVWHYHGWFFVHFGEFPSIGSDYDASKGTVAGLMEAMLATASARDRERWLDEERADSDVEDS